MPSTARTAPAIFASSGRTNASIGSLYGTVASSAVTCRTGARNVENPCSAMSAAMSAETDPYRVAWSTSTTWPVLATEARIVSVSSGWTARVDHLSLDALAGQLLAQKIATNDEQIVI